MTRKRRRKVSSVRRRTPLRRARSEVSAAGAFQRPALRVPPMSSVTAGRLVIERRGTVAHGHVRADPRGRVGLLVLAPDRSGARGAWPRCRDHGPAGRRRLGGARRVHRHGRRRDRRPHRPRRGRPVPRRIHRAARLRPGTGRPDGAGRGDGAGAGGVGRGLVGEHGCGGGTPRASRARWTRGRRRLRPLRLLPPRRAGRRGRGVGPAPARAVGHTVREAVAARRVARRADAVPALPRRPLLPGRLQRRVVRERLGITPDEMDGGHLPALAHPKELAERLLAFHDELDPATPVPER